MAGVQLFKSYIKMLNVKNGLGEPIFSVNKELCWIFKPARLVFKGQCFHQLRSRCIAESQ